ncbi:MAG: aquaporin family protein [Cyanobacteria bacterium RM1_2_2]|nr:aquaporin family protein [Cyanobacteria bacterium RM1_2_2]
MYTLRRHYPEYLMEAAGLGIFMIAASGVTVLVEHPASLVRQVIPDPVLRRFMIGVAMGLMAITIVYSPWGKQSGAHLNPAVTFTFFRLGKVNGCDAIFYMVAQCIGGLSGVLIAAMLFREAIADSTVNYIVTLPGSRGTGVAFLAELIISFGLMTMILIVSNHAKLSRFTGLFSGILVAIYITVEAPLSGMSMNPARTLASAIPAQNWTAIWIYFTAPLLGMLLAAELYVRLKGRAAVRCAKLHHHNHKRCIFRCGYQSLPMTSPPQGLSDQLPH